MAMAIAKAKTSTETVRIDAKFISAGLWLQTHNGGPVPVDIADTPVEGDKNTIGIDLSDGSVVTASIKDKMSILCGCAITPTTVFTLSLIHI